MRTGMILRIAIKNLFLHPLRTTLTVVGVTIGIGAIVFLVSLGYGLERLVTQQVANFNAFTVIDVPAANLKTLRLNQGSIEKIKEFGHVEKITPVINLAGRVKRADGSSTTETVIVGGDEDYWKLSEIYAESGRLPKEQKEAVVNRSVLNLIEETPETVIGKELAIDAIIPKEMQEDENFGLKVAEDLRVTIVGVIGDEKSPIMLVGTGLLQSAGTGNYSSLKIKVDNRDNVETVRQQLENIGYSSEYVGDTVKEIAQVFSLFRAILAAFGFIALIVAALGAFNTLTISLLERIREVGLFKALGMRNRDIYKLFLTESLIIGFAGGAFGLVIAELIGLGANAALTYMAKQSGAEAVTIFITPAFFCFIIAGFSLIVGFITGWYPARRAVKLNPLDALRYE